ncbi:MAG: LptF/LptG family permease [Planctomycetota bacterium]
MKILTQYILLDLIATFLATLISMTVFVLVFLVGDEAIDKGLGLSAVLRTIPYFLPQAMALTVPGTMLLATTIVYGRVASGNEIVAVKSLGVTPMSLVKPALILAAITSVGAVWLNDIAVSWGRDGVQRVFFESLEQIALGRLESQGSFTFGEWEVNVAAVQGGTLIHPVVRKNTAGGPPWLIDADTAEVRVDKQHNSLVFKLLNAEGEVKGRVFSLPGEFEQEVTFDELTGRGRSSRSPSQYALREIGPAKAEQLHRLEVLGEETATDTAFTLITGGSADTARGDDPQRRRQHAHATALLHRFGTEPHRRWSGGFSCLSFVLIGAPMAIRRRHGEFWGSFFACFLPILIVFYPMLAVTVDQAKDGGVPPVAVWLGNLVLAAWGVLLLRRVLRY